MKYKKLKAEKYKPEYDTCSGPSMYPTLRGGDGIQLEKYTNRLDVRVGDIIVYPHPERPIDVVHRIIRLKEKGVITRGDNNNKVDPYLIKYEDIKGKIRAVKRDKKEIHLVQGYTGYIIHRIMLLRKYSRPHIRYPFAVLSKILAKSRMLNFIDPLIKTKVIYIKRNNEQEALLVRGNNKLIGRRCRETADKWKIIFPYKLFIKTEELP